MKKIKTLRNDNGIEYTLTLFIEYCVSSGIKREFTIPYNSQKNRGIERKNRTIVEEMKSMMC